MQRFMYSTPFSNTDVLLFYVMFSRSRMQPAASFSQRWARENLTRPASDDELAILGLFLSTCSGDEAEASKRARRYYTARGPGGLSQLWHKRHPDDEDILSSCQDA